MKLFPPRAPARATASERGGYVFVALLVLCVPILAQAAVVVPPSVSAGASQRRSQESRQRLRQRLASPGVSGPVLIGPPGTPGVPNVKSGGPRFVLQHIMITPSHFLAKAALDRLAAEYLHRPVNLADLYRLVSKINSLYAKRGLITDRAFLPPQRITHGTVRIELVEGRLGKIELSGRPYTDRAFILSRLHVHPGQVLDAPALRSALEYFNRTNGLGLRAQLSPGVSFGLSNILLHVLEPPRYQLNVLANNEGDAYTGRAQAGVYGVFNGPLRAGDSFSLYFVGSRGAYNYDAQYALPLTTNGLKLTLSASHDHIHIISGPYDALNIQGNGDQQSATLSQPLLATVHWRLSVGVSLTHARSRTTTLGGFPLSDTQSWIPGLGLSAGYAASHRQGWSVSVTFSHPVVEGAGSAAGHAWLLNATFDGRVGLPFPGWSVNVQSSAQDSSSSSLTSSLLYQLGGAGSVLGYPSGAVAGVRGYFAEFGLNRRLPWALRAKVFYARGSVYTSVQPTLTLDSAGLGIAGRLPAWGHLGHSAWSFMVARPLRTVLPDQSSVTAYFSIIVPLDF